MRWLTRSYPAASSSTSPAFHAVAPNITPDNATGIGRWTDEQLVNAIRNGKRPDGTTIGPPMPIQFYRNMSDTDVRAIVAYMRSVTPISRKVEKSTYRIPLPDSYGPPVTDVAECQAATRSSMVATLPISATAWSATRPMVNGRLDLARIGSGGREIPRIPGRRGDHGEPDARQSGRHCTTGRMLR